VTRRLPVSNANPLRVYWFNSVPNYGDLLTPYILKALNIPFTPARSGNFNAIMVGSIAKIARRGTHVLGSGFIRTNDPVNAHAIYKWLRGPLSREKVLSRSGARPPRVYGDAAWLLPEFWSPSPKKYKLGIVPHYVDYEIAKKIWPGERVIHLLNPDCEAVTREITECEKIVSSSLHGLIVAHAYGIPAAYVKLSDKLSGDGFKFHDHYASMGLELIPSTIDRFNFQLGTVSIENILEILECYRS